MLEASDKVETARDFEVSTESGSDRVATTARSSWGRAQPGRYRSRY
jgi:hypothetical protein